MEKLDMMKKIRVGRMNRRVGGALLAGLLLMLPLSGFGRDKPRGEFGCGLCCLFLGGADAEFDANGFLLGFLSYRGPMKTAQFGLDAFVTIPPTPAVVLMGNVVFNLAKPSPFVPYLTAAIGAVVPYVAPLCNIGAGVRLRLSDHTALLLEYRRWFFFVEGCEGLGSLSAQIHFRI